MLLNGAGSATRASARFRDAGSHELPNPGLVRAGTIPRDADC